MQRQKQRSNHTNKANQIKTEPWDCILVVKPRFRRNPKKWWLKPWEATCKGQNLWLHSSLLTGLPAPNCSARQVQAALAQPMWDASSQSQTTGPWTRGSGSSCRVEKHLGLLRVAERTGAAPEGRGGSWDRSVSRLILCTRRLARHVKVGLLSREQS